MTRLETDEVFKPIPEVTPFDDRVYSFVRSEIMSTCICPSVREIKAALSAGSTSTVKLSIDRLVKAGYLTNTPHQTRSLRVPGARMVMLDGEGKNQAVTTWAAFNYDLPRFAQYVDELTALLMALEQRFGDKEKLPDE